MTTSDYILDKLRQLWPCDSAYLEHELRIDKARGALEEEEAKAIGQVGSILRYWEREGRAKEIDGKWHWLPDNKPKVIQKELF